MILPYDNIVDLLNNEFIFIFLPCLFIYVIYEGYVFVKEELY